ncbi:MAG: T9SS type A sorting domain-containing protein [Bacteroidia bacterium]
MKKILLSTFAVIVASLGFGQTAVDVTVTDCASASHHLFAELDAGKVVVLCWVMPCATCIAPASMGASVVKSKANPNVVFYLVDDAGDTNCKTLTDWSTKNKIPTNAVFGNAGNVIKMTDYGTEDMPKTVILGGKDHHVFYNQNGAVSSSDMQTAIDKALVTGIEETANGSMKLTIYPNPVAAIAMVSYTLINASTVTIQVMDVVGKTVKMVALGNQSSGKQEYQLNLELLTSGIYLVKLNAGETTETFKLTVTK